MTDTQTKILDMIILSLIWNQEVLIRCKSFYGIRMFRVKLSTKNKKEIYTRRSVMGIRHERIILFNLENIMYVSDSKVGLFQVFTQKS